MIRELILDYTRKCNSECTTCSIWKTSGPELSLDMIEHILSSQSVRGLQSVYVTGGEPYLTDKIVDIADLIHRYLPGCMLLGATNGIDTRGILYKVVSIRDMGVPIVVDVSINGHVEAHTRTRGDNWHNALATFYALKDLGVPVNVAFTVHPETYRDYGFIKEFCRQEMVGLGLSWARTSDRYGSVSVEWPGDFRQESVEKLPAYFDCPGSREIVVVNPWGEVWPCEQYDIEWLCLGKLCENPLDKILARPRTQRVIERIQAGECQPYDFRNGPCYMDCYARKGGNNGRQ